MEIVICDDEHEVLEKVAQICKKSFLSKVTIYAFPSAESLLKNLSSDMGTIDLFILDIEMPGKSGLWLKHELELNWYESSIIYLTSHEELIHEAFGRNVIGFVDKAKFYKDDDILISKLKIFEKSLENKSIISIRDEDGSFYIQKDRIILIKSEHVYTIVEYSTGKMNGGYLESDKKLLRKTLKNWEVDLNNDFLRISKSVIVNMDYISRMGREIILKNGACLSIPRANYNKCEDAYFEFCKRKMKWN